MSDTRYMKSRPRPYYQLVTDPDWTYVRRRTFATLLIFGIFGSAIAKKIYDRERMRIHRTERLAENLANKPAHHFINKGGVLIKKEFVGFTKYFKNDKELTKWYNKVYPHIMHAPKK